MTVLNWIRRKLYFAEHEVQELQHRLDSVSPEEALAAVRRARPGAARFRWTYTPATPLLPVPDCGLPPVARAILTTMTIEGEDTGLKVSADLLRPSSRIPLGLVVGREEAFHCEYVVLPDETVIVDDDEASGSADRYRSLAHFLLVTGHMSRAFDAYTCLAG